MSIEPRGLDVFVAESFLDRADIVAARQQVCGNGVPEGVTGGERNGVVMMCLLLPGHLTMTPPMFT